MYCPSCGAELAPNAKFCSECGLAFDKDSATPVEQLAPTIAPRRSSPAPSPVTPQGASPSTTPTTTKKIHRRAGKIFVSAILVLALIGAGFAIVTVMTWGSYQGSVTYSYDPAVPSTADTWSFSVDSADLDIKYTTNTSAPEVQVNIRYDFAGGFLVGKTPADLYTISWNNESGAKQFALETKNWWSFPMVQNNLVTVTLKSGINYSITASTSTGFVHISVPDNENVSALTLAASTGNAKAIIGNSVNVIGNVSFEASTGSATFSMEDGCKIGGLLDVSASTGSASIAALNSELASGVSLSSSTGTANLSLNGTLLGDDIVVETSTGSSIVVIRNITLSTNIDLNVSVSTGSVNINVDQTINPGGNITARFTTSTGSAYITYKGDATFASAKFLTSTSTGSAHFTNAGGFTKVSPTEFRSDNQSNPTRFNAQVTTSTGSAYITGQMI